MSLPTWLNPIVDVLDNPADFAHLKPKESTQHRESAVLLLFSEFVSEPNLTFIKRAATLKHHPNQIALPGGVIEVTDADAVAAALREAQEEIGLTPESVLPIGKLPKISIEVTGFAVTPVISYWHDPHEVSVKQPAEVAEVFSVPVETLLLPANQVWATKHNYKGPAFLIEDKLIWGFTGTLIAQLFSSAGLISEFVGHREIEVKL
jgi:8-oxo-dGTP pyrophosphatase MutT (NUDIX family)